MARYCSQCNRKIGFFEEDFDGMCKSCFEEKQKQEELSHIISSPISK